MGPKGSCEDGEHCADHLKAEADRAVLQETVKTLCAQISKHVESNQELLPKLYEMMAEVKQARIDNARHEAELTAHKESTDRRLQELERFRIKIITAATIGGLVGGAGAQPLFKAMAAALGAGG